MLGVSHASTSGYQSMSQLTDYTDCTEFKPPQPKVCKRFDFFVAPGTTPSLNHRSLRYVNVLISLLPQAQHFHSNQISIQLGLLGYTVRMVFRRLWVWSLAAPEIWSWNNFYSHSDSIRIVFTYWQKNGHLVLVKHIGSLPRNSVDMLTDRLDLTLVVDCTIRPQHRQTNFYSCSSCSIFLFFTIMTMEVNLRAKS